MFFLSMVLTVELAMIYNLQGSGPADPRGGAGTRVTPRTRRMKQTAGGGHSSGGGGGAEQGAGVDVAA